MHMTLFVRKTYHGLHSTSPDELDHSEPMKSRHYGTILLSHSTEDERQHCFLEHVHV